MNAKRLIDADALKALFDERYDTAFMQMHTRDNKEHWNGICAGVNWGRNTIADAPTVDAVEVVRCRDCAWYDESKRCVNSHCTKSYYGCRVPAEHYCSYGERRCEE